MRKRRAQTIDGRHSALEKLQAATSIGTPDSPSTPAATNARVR
jgi:hypothetical protein